VINLSFGQTIEELFSVLPSEYTPYLSITGKDSLLKFKTYTIPGGDSVETLEVTFSEEVDVDFIRLDYLFTTGQNGFISIQLRKFVKNNGDVVLVYSRHSGMKRAFDQYELLTFDNLKGQLFLIKNLGLPETTPIRLFLKSNSPESLNSMTLSTGYDLNPDLPNSVEYYLYPETDFDNWIEKDKIIYTWDGNKFTPTSEK